MTETASESGSGIWKEFLRKHWAIVPLFAVGAALAVAGAVLVCLWFVGEAQLSGLVPTTLGSWTMGYFVTFLLHLIFWEALIIGVPVVVVAAAVFWLWWRRLPDLDKKVFGTGSRTSSGGGGVSALVFIAFCIKVHLDGMWNVAFADWTFDYVVYSCLATLVWILVIFGIPIALGLIWWIHHEIHRKP